MTYRCTSDGKKISLLGYGAMRLPTVDGGHANIWDKNGLSDKPIDQELLNRQIKLALDGGVNYFDTSPAYCRGASERCIGTALAASGYARGDYFLATKLSNFSPSQHPLDACKAMFEKSLEYLRTDYIDNYLLHNIGIGGMDNFRRRYLDNGAADWCATLRAEKRIRNLGFSYHGDPKTFEWCLDHHATYKWDFCQIQMNYVDWDHAAEVDSKNLNARYLYDRLAELGIPVVVMEPLLGGRLARYNHALAHELMPLDPGGTLAKWALRFCGSFDRVVTVLSGMTRTEHIEENLATFASFKPCTREEFAALDRAARALLAQKTIPCNSCNYCVPCPYGVDIPQVLQFRNMVLAEQADPKAKTDARRILSLYAKMVPEELRRAEHCTGCGRCKEHCPQMIDVPEALLAIDRWIDGLKAEAAR